MTLQPRTTLLAATIATTLVACSEDSPPEITGENTLINSPSFAVLDANGSDLTAVNQTNFPLPNEQSSTASTVQAEAPAANVSSLGTSEADSESVANSEPASETGAEPDIGAAIDAGVGSTEDFFQSETAIEVSDRLGVITGSLLDSVGGVLISEYEIATGAVVFSDDTVEITKRLAQGCDLGDVEASLNLNGTTITDGTVEFSRCGRAGATLSGLISLETTNVQGVERLELEFQNFTAEIASEAFTLTGLVELEFMGDEVTLTSVELNMVDDTAQQRWRNTLVVASVSDSGFRSMGGETTLVNDTDGSEISVRLSQIEVRPDRSFPNSGRQTLRHNDGSQVQFLYAPDGEEGTFQTLVIGSDGTMSEWVDGLEEDVQSRVPFSTGI